MDLQQCWMCYLKADQQSAHGHWSTAHQLYDQVLKHFPTHIHAAMKMKDTKACQFSCLLAGLTNATIAQSQILNRMEQHQSVFDLLSQNYTLLQFIAIETSDLVNDIQDNLEQNCNELLRCIKTFCLAQNNTQWMREYQHLEKNHQHFSAVKLYNGTQIRANSLN